MQAAFPSAIHMLSTDPLRSDLSIYSMNLRSGGTPVQNGKNFTEYSLFTHGRSIRTLGKRC
jgi:hypothetical protein